MTTLPYRQAAEVEMKVGMTQANPAPVTKVETEEELTARLEEEARIAEIENKRLKIVIVSSEVRRGTCMCLGARAACGVVETWAERAALPAPCVHSAAPPR